MRFACGLVLVVACYAPRPPAGAPCSGPDTCPIGQTCTASAGLDGVCVTGDATIDAALDDARASDAAVDVGHVDAPNNCFGTGLVQFCLAAAPTMPLTIAAPVVIDTATAIVCQAIGQTTGPELCVLAATTIDILASATIVVTGPRPLVIVATGAVTLSGTLDAASHRAGAIGPGAQASCGTGLDGSVGVVLSGGGGGAGGGFGTGGGNGGKGGNTLGGGAATPVAPIALIGGCPGGHGGPSINGTGAGLPGAGGGAIYIISKSTIQITGRIDASGAGGGAGNFLNGGGGGGGAGGGGTGGMIGLDAPSIDVTGALFANGGGGGGGGGSQAGHGGTDGGEATSATTAVSGGNGGMTGGGSGGGGFSQLGAAGVGASATGLLSGGGGGGGGAGVIRVFPPQALAGAVSPPAS